MKNYTLTEAQQLVKDDLAFIEFDIDNADLLNEVFENNYNFGGAWKYYSTFDCDSDIEKFLNRPIHIKISQIQPDPIPNDILKIVEKYGVDKMITYFELIKK